jgi:hypothetical protein
LAAGTTNDEHANGAALDDELASTILANGLTRTSTSHQRLLPYSVCDERIVAMLDELLAAVVGAAMCVVDGIEPLARVEVVRFAATQALDLPIEIEMIDGRPPLAARATEVAPYLDPSALDHDEERSTADRSQSPAAVSETRRAARWAR